MYNRYTPQNDGSYRRCRVQESSPEPNIRESEVQPLPCPPVREQAPVPQNMGSFFRQLIPKGFDTEDLIIVLLLLLIAGDCREDQNMALLTLALYLFMGE